MRVSKSPCAVAAVVGERTFSRAQLPADHTAWPEFHNGVAAALRLSLGRAAISRTWIVYNKPETATFQHAGVLMGLGLQVCSAPSV